MKQKTVLWLFLICLPVLGACRSGEGGGGLQLFGAQPTQLDSSSAETVATTFLDAWKDRDYATMYSLITPNARAAFSQDEFVSIYEDVRVNKLGLRDLSWEITAGPLVQGTTATLEYKVTLDTTLLGVFTDPDPTLPNTPPRTMWLIVVANEGWRIAWSRMDIFMGWTNDSDLVLERVMPRRGNIYDRNGKVLVDQGGTAISVYLVRNRIPNLEQCVHDLARIFRLEQSDARAEIESYAGDTEFLFGEISQDTANQEDAFLRSSCNYISRPRQTRQYYDNVAPHLIGYIGRIPADRQADYRAQSYPDDALVGLSGIEQAFENELRGTIGVRLTIRSATGLPIRTVATVAPESGRSLYLTIDRDLQLGVQALVADAYNNAQPTWAPTSKGAAVVVVKVNTGEILAMVSYPDFDPGVFNPDTQVWDAAAEIQHYRDDVRTPLLNRATRGAYPLGSVFKVFAMVAALDSGVWSPGNTFTCTGTWDGTSYGDRIRYDWKPDGHGPLNMQGGLINSCNPYFWNLSMALNSHDPNLLPSYAKRFGFGSPPSFQGIGVDAGQIPSPDWKIRQPQGQPWTNSDAANLVIGQGDVLVNPLQVVLATAVVANGGTLYQPTIVSQISRAGEAPIFVNTPTGQNLGFDAQVLALTREAMCAVTTSYTGTANFVFQEWYERNNYQIIVCGKTGTAQSGQAHPHAWFTAFAPEENPEIAVVSIVENSCEGSEVSAPIVRRVIELYYNLPTWQTNFGWPQLWQGGCTQIGPDATG